MATVMFDDLKDNTKYDIWISAGNSMPYYPSILLDDDQIKKISILVPKNLNLDRCSVLNDMQNYNPKLAAAL